MTWSRSPRGRSKAMCCRVRNCPGNWRWITRPASAFGNGGGLVDPTLQAAFAAPAPWKFGAVEIVMPDYNLRLLEDRKSVVYGKRLSVLVTHGGCGNIKKKNRISQKIRRPH